MIDRKVNHRLYQGIQETIKGTRVSLHFGIQKVNGKRCHADWFDSS